MASVRPKKIMLARVRPFTSASYLGCLSTCSTTSFCIFILLGSLLLRSQRYGSWSIDVLPPLDFWVVMEWMAESRYWRSAARKCALRSEEHTSELQSRENLVCRLLLEKKKGHMEL